MFERGDFGDTLIKFSVFVLMGLILSSLVWDVPFVLSDRIVVVDSEESAERIRAVMQENTDLKNKVANLNGEITSLEKELEESRRLQVPQPPDYTGAFFFLALFGFGTVVIGGYYWLEAKKLQTATKENQKKEKRS